MEQTAILGPFLATMALTFAVWTYMYIRRIAFLQASGVDPQDLTGPGALERISPAAVSNPSDNLKNLFEMPLLLYALTLYLFASAQVDAVDVALGWVFVAFRVLHSAVHCTFNRVMLRFWLYFIASLALWLMLGRAVWAHIAG